MVRDWNRHAIDKASRLRWRPGTIERSPLQLEGDYPKRALADASVYCPILVGRLLKAAGRMVACCGALCRLWAAGCHNSRLSSSLQVIFSGCLVFWLSGVLAVVAAMVRPGPSMPSFLRRPIGGFRRSA
jgi:hypothetical protein